MSRAVILSAVRTPIDRYGGALADAAWTARVHALASARLSSRKGGKPVAGPPDLLSSLITVGQHRRRQERRARDVRSSYAGS